MHNDVGPADTALINNPELLTDERPVTDFRDPSVDRSIDGIDHSVCGSTGRKKIDRYVLQCLLGEGGMGVVFEANDSQLNRQVALKILRPEFNDDPIARERFAREARYMAALQHPEICPVYELGEWRNVHFIAMRYLRGTPLCDRSGSSPSMEPPDAVDCILKLAQALAYAHRKDVLHRDLKPANIILCDGQPVLTDFGMARHIERYEQITESNEPVGTLAYMPIEQFRADHDAIGPQSDVYSLGAIFFELLTGRPPFIGEWADVMKQIVRSPQPCPVDYCDGLDPAIDELCQQMIAKEPDDRIASMSEVVDTLKCWRDDALDLDRPQTQVAVATEVSPLLSGSDVRVTEFLLRGKPPTVMIAGSPFFIGRDRQRCDLIIDRPEVSRLHVSVVSSENEEAPLLIDLNSRKGVRVNGRRVHTATLRENGKFRVGTIRVRYRSDVYQQRHSDVFVGPVLTSLDRATLRRAVWRRRRRNRLVGSLELAKPFVASQGGTSQMARVLRATALRVRHPNVVRSYRLFEESDRLTLIQDYPVGGTLVTRRAGKGGHFTIAQIIRMGTALTNALDFCESQELLHGAICPEIVHFDVCGTARLGDVLLPTSLMPPPSASPPEFTAPEVIADSSAADAHAEMFSLAATLRWALGEEFPDAGEDDLATRQRIIDVLGQATETDRTDRFDSMIAFRQAWRDATTTSRLEGASSQSA